MSKKYDAADLKQVLQSFHQGQSLGEISRQSGVPKTTVKRFIDQALATKHSIEELLDMSNAAMAKLLTPSRRVRMNFDEPDWETVYLRCERPRKPWNIKSCWQEYCKRGDPKGKTMSYLAYCRAYNEYKQDLPASMRDVSMSFEWMPGEVAMIDYSGDPLFFTDSDGKRRKAEIFVGVMPYSNCIFCTATPDQTRNSWLAACKAM